MKRFKYTPLWLLLSVALSVIVTISFMEDIRIGEWTVKKAPIKEFILQDNKFDLLADSDINASDSAEIVGGVSSEEVVRTETCAVCTSERSCDPFCKLGFEQYKNMG